MAKQHYFAVCVEEDGFAWVDGEITINAYNGGDVWNIDTSEWESHTTDENVEANELALHRLSEILNNAPTEPKERKMGKHAGHYDLRYDLGEAKDTLFEQLGVDLDTWQLIARDLARDITRGYGNNPDAQDFAYDILNRLSHMAEMNIHPSELSK